MNNEMLKKLNAFVGTDTLLSLYSDTEEPDSFTLGYLLLADNDFILVNMINSFGEENGFCIIRLNDIFIFDIDKIYSEKMQKLFLIKNQKRRYIENTDTNPVASFLNYAISNKLLIEINEDDSYMGYVAEFSKETLDLQLIDNYCADTGIAVIDMKNVNILKCQNKYLKDLELLASN